VSFLSSAPPSSELYHVFIFFQPRTDVTCQRLARLGKHKHLLCYLTTHAAASTFTRSRRSATLSIIGIVNTEHRRTAVAFLKHCRLSLHMPFLLSSIFNRTPTTAPSSTMQGKPNLLKRKRSADNKGDDEEWSDVSSQGSTPPGTVEDDSRRCGGMAYTEEERALLTSSKFVFHVPVYHSHSATYRGKLHQYTGQRPKLSHCRSSQIQKRGYSCSKERPSSTIFALLLHPKSNTAIIVRVASYLGCQIASILVRTAARYLADVSAVQYPVSSTTRELRESLDSSLRHPCVSLLDPTTNLD
jgi:hypothetical protein